MKTQNKTMTAKQFIDALTQGEIVPNGTEVIAPKGAVVDYKDRLAVLRVPHLKHFPGVKVIGDLFIIDCPNLETIDPELTVTGEFQVNSCPNLTNIHNPQCSEFVIWICPNIVELPELSHEGLLEVRVAGIGCTKVSKITAVNEIRFHQCKNLVEVSDFHSAIVAFTESPELQIVNNITCTKELQFNGSPKIVDLPDIGDGNHLQCMMLADTGVQVIPNTYFDTGADKPMHEHSQVLFINNPALHAIPAIVVEELDIFNCPGVNSIPSGTRVNLLELSSWTVTCEPGVIINDKLRIKDGSVDIEDFLNNRVVKPETSSSESDEEYDILGP